MEPSDVLAHDQATGRTARGAPGFVTLDGPDGAISLVIGNDEMGPHTPISVAFAGNVVVVRCEQAVSNTDSMHALFVFTKGKQTPVLAVPSQKALAKFDWDEGSTNGVTAWAVAERGTRLATWWSGEGLALWDVKTRKRERVLRKPDPDEEVAVLALAFDAKATRLAALVDGALEVYACTTGKRVFREEIAETFGDSQLAFDDEGVVWTRKAPGVDERRVFGIPRR